MQLIDASGTLSAAALSTLAAEAAPSAERIAQVHAKYILAVKELHARYKEIYDPKAQPVELV